MCGDKVTACCAASNRFREGVHDSNRAGELCGAECPDATEDVRDLLCVNECNVPPEATVCVGLGAGTIGVRAGLCVRLCGHKVPTCCAGSYRGSRGTNGAGEVCGEETPDDTEDLLCVDE